MQAGRLNLTTKDIDHTNQIVEVGPMFFSMQWSQTAGRSVVGLRVSLRNGSAPKPRPSRSMSSGPNDHSLRCNMSAVGAASFLNQLVLVCDPIPVLHPAPATIPTVQDDGSPIAGESLIFDFAREDNAAFPANIHLYCFTLTHTGVPADHALSFKLTNTETSGIVSLVDDLVFFNYSGPGY